MIVFSEEVGFRKPQPEIFLHALEELGVEPENAMFVGDRLDTDVQGAAQVGMATVQALWFRADDIPRDRAGLHGVHADGRAERGPAISALRTESQVLRLSASARTMRSMTQEQIAAPALPLRPQDEMECRRCDVHCDKVVYPGACLARGCPFVYSYEAWGHTYVGCMQKVYEVEIDVDMLRAAEARKPGFGAIRAMRRPLPMCKAEIEPTYESRAEDLGCVNPEFHELPGRRADVPRLRAAQGRLSSASSRRRRIIRTTSQTSSDEHEQRRADRQCVHRADPEPRRTRRRAPCSGPWPCLCGDDGFRAGRCSCTVA